MQCTKRISKQLLLERYYRERARLLNLYCQRKESLSTSYESYGTNYVSGEYFYGSNVSRDYLKQSRNLGVNCFKEKAHYLGNGYLIPDYSTRVRKLNAIKQGKGTTQISTLLLNDYGKIEGSPGGFGSSLKNRF